MLHLLKFFVGVAQAFVFQAPQTSPTDFKRFLVKQNYESYQEWKKKKIEDPQKEAHEQILRFSQRTLNERFSEETMKEWERLRLSLDLNNEDREILYHLAKKLMEQNPQKTLLQKEVCRYTVLDRDHSESGCENFLQKVAFDRVLRDEDLLVIDGMAFSKGQYPTKMVPGNYSWRRISNVYQEETWQGDLKSIPAWSFQNRNWVVGACKEYHLDTQDFELITQSQIYFSDTCAMPGVPYQRTWKDWAHENKNLLLGVGLVTAGLVAYSLKDKTLLITLPSK